jgi:hypothetical protein
MRVPASWPWRPATAAAAVLAAASVGIAGCGSGSGPATPEGLNGTEVGAPASRQPNSTAPPPPTSSSRPPISGLLSPFRPTCPPRPAMPAAGMS